MLEYVDSGPHSGSFAGICVRKWSSYLLWMLCFKILFSGQFKKEGCMTELQINLTVFAVSGVLPLFPGALLFGWLTEACTAFCHCCTAHGKQMFAGWVPGWCWDLCTVSTDVAPFQGELDKHTCGQDHLLLTSSTFLQLAGINELFWILCVWDEKDIGTLRTVGLNGTLKKI